MSDRQTYLMETVYGNFVLHGPASETVQMERIIKSWIRTEIIIQQDALEHQMLESEKELYSKLLVDLDEDLTHNFTRTLSLDEVVRRLEDELGWTTGPDGDPSFKVERLVKG